ncbi:MAG: hypothetical protein ACJ8KU_05255 [Chthoniobacterales bacterium]
MQLPPDERVIPHIKRLIWIYFWLLIFEGALRKWLLPRFSDPLLIVRDPVVLAIYLLAIKAHVFPRNGFVFSLAIIAGLAWPIGALVLEPYLSWKPLLFVTGYGFRSNFLHLPLIFVIAKVFSSDDVKKMGWWILLLLIPLTLLVAMQFSASPDAFINRTAGTGEAQQITAGGGKIRPPGTFSFISGMIFYAAASAAFLIYGALSRGTYRNWLLFAAGFALVVTTAVSGSRSVLLAILIVVASLAVIILVRPSAINSFGRNLLIVVAVGLIVTRLPIFKEGLEILGERFTASAEAGETTVAGDLLTRVTSGFQEGFYVLTKAPAFGYGLGIGTNAGAKFLTGRSMFLLAEGEWTRVLLESGPIVGFAFIVWRILIAFRLGLLSLRLLRSGEVLPIILYSACFLTLVNGQFGQPTNLGFAVLLGGLCLASTNLDYYRIRPAEKERPTGGDPPVKRLPRRSPHAERLHQTVAPREQPNGAADR